MDYSSISVEHLHTVMSLIIDDKGSDGGCADHNWMFFNSEGQLCEKEVSVEQTAKKY